MTLAVGQAGALAMTLPRLIEEALRRRYRDHSLRYTYPLASWSLERSTDRNATALLDPLEEATAG